MARRLLPAVIVIPSLVGWLGWLGRHKGMLDRVMGLSLFVLTNIIILTALDLVERGFAQQNGPRPAAGGAAPGNPVHGDARSGGITRARRRRAQDLASDLRRPGLDGGCPVVGRPRGQRTALRRRVALAVVAGGGVRGAEPANDVRRGVGLPGRVWASGKPAWIPDVVTDTNFPRGRVAAREGLHGAFGFPIVVDSDILGVMEVFSGEIQRPDTDLLRMLAAIGSQIGQFMKRKQAEEAVPQERYLLHTLMDTVPDSIYFKDAEGRFIHISKAWPIGSA